MHLNSIGKMSEGKDVCSVCDMKIKRNIYLSAMIWSKKYFLPFFPFTFSFCFSTSLLYFFSFTSFLCDLIRTYRNKYKKSVSLSFSFCYSSIDNNWSSFPFQVFSNMKFFVHLRRFGNVSIVDFSDSIIGWITLALAFGD